MNEFTCSEQSLRIRRSEKTQHWKSTLSLVPNSDCSIVTHFLLLFEFECMTPTCLQRMPKIYMDDALSCFFYTLYIYRELPSVTIRSAAHQKCCTSKLRSRFVTLTFICSKTPNVKSPFLTNGFFINVCTASQCLDLNAGLRRLTTAGIPCLKLVTSCFRPLTTLLGGRP